MVSEGILLLVLHWGWLGKAAAGGGACESAQADEQQDKGESGRTW